MPAPNTLAEATRNGRRPNRSAAHPRSAMARIEAAAPHEAVEGDRYELAHYDGQGRDLYRRPSRVEYQVQETRPDKELQPQGHVAHYPPRYVRTEPGPESPEDCPHDADEDHHAPHEQQRRPQNVQPSVVHLHPSLAVRDVALGLRQVLLALELFL